MKLIKTTIKGTNDFLPEEQALREYILNKIKEVYSGFGYSLIETPCIEHIENLLGKQGGENEKLIFKILKRGEKLNNITDISQAADSGLRYDLTLPLARYFANNAENLPSPFKALQIGNVWRADRPQKGRFRQFMQCDIDILGDDTSLAETDLLLASATLLKALGFKDFSIRINDRKLLKQTAESCNIPEDKIPGSFIILDKFDKIGTEGVTKELETLGLTAAEAQNYINAVLNSKPGKDIENITENIKASGATGFNIVYDPTLVRGMGYYTGCIFEITMEELGLSVAGGGRYDEMIGKFGSAPTPACGFSIGFERIYTILKDRGFTPNLKNKSICFLIDKKADEKNVALAFNKAENLRKTGARVMVTKKNKNTRFQKEKLNKLGFTEFKEIF